MSSDNYLGLAIAGEQLKNNSVCKVENIGSQLYIFNLNSPQDLTLSKTVFVSNVLINDEIYIKAHESVRYKHVAVVSL